MFNLLALRRILGSAKSIFATGNTCRPKYMGLEKYLFLLYDDARANLGTQVRPPIAAFYDIGTAAL